MRSPSTIFTSTTLLASLVACGPDIASPEVDEETSETGATTDEPESSSGEAETSDDPPLEDMMSEDCDYMCPDGSCVSDGGGQFVPDPGNPCCGHGYEGPECFGGDGDCDIWNPDDCAEGGKCTAYATSGSSWDANKCVEIEGDGQLGDDCVATDGSGVSGHDDCGAGRLCWDIDPDTSIGYCLAFCQGNPDNPVCPDDTQCAIFNDGVLPLCLTGCDPLIGGSDCPNNDNVCVADPGGGGFVCVLDASGGMGTSGAECQYVNSCNQGLFCADAQAVPNCQGAQGCCSPFCDLNEVNTCPGKDQGQECVPWFEMDMVPPGYEAVGGCAIPE